jgi:hypothetical protein
MKATFVILSAGSSPVCAKNLTGCSGELGGGQYQILRTEGTTAGPQDDGRVR